MADLAAQQRLLISWIALELVQAGQRIPGRRAMRRCFSAMIISERRDTPVKQITSEVSNSLMTARHPQPVDDDAVVGEELDEVGAAERRRVLVLLAAGQAEVDALDPEGEMRHVVEAERQFEEEAERFDQRDHQGGGRPRPDPAGAST